MLRAAATHPPLVQVVVPHRGLLRDLLVILGFSLLIAACAQISIPLPFTDVPISGQTLGVLLTGALLGSKRGGLAVVAYLLEGMAGLPVFALGNNAWTLTRSGVPVIMGPTAGFLFGFPIAAFVAGWLAERGWDRSYLRSIVAMAVANLLLYVPGLLWLSKFVGLAAAVPLGMLPFLPGDVIKILLAASAVPSAWLLLGRRGARAED